MSDQDTRSIARPTPSA